MEITYKFDNNLYVNLTNKCASACTCCIKNKWDWNFHGHKLQLKSEPTAKEVIKRIKDPKKYKEIVFCGYGEPLLRVDVLLEIAKYVKENGGKVRVNTSGLANLYHKKNIIPMLKNLVDSISISVNSVNSKDYLKLHRPIFGIASYSGVLAFAKACKKIIKDTTITFIDFPGSNHNKFKAIAKRIGVKFRIRPYLDESKND